MKRVVVDHFGAREALTVVEDEDPRPGPGEVRVRVLAARVSFTDAQLRAGTYLGVPKPPFTPGYELGAAEELGPACSRLRPGLRVAALTAYGGYAERVCVPEAEAVEVPDGELDPAQVVSLVLTYTTAYQLLQRKASARSGETVLVHGAGGRVGNAVLKLGALAGLRLFGTASARDWAAVERLGAVAIDYQREDFLTRVRELTGDGVDVVLDGLGGVTSLRSFRALGHGGWSLGRPLRHSRLRAQEPPGVARVVCHDRGRGTVRPARAPPASARLPRPAAARQSPMAARGRTAPRAPGGWRPPATAVVPAGFSVLLELLRGDKIHPVVAEPLPLSDARRAHELLEGSAAKGNSSSCRNRLRRRGHDHDRAGPLAATAAGRRGAVPANRTGRHRRWSCMAHRAGDRLVLGDTCAALGTPTVAPASSAVTIPAARPGPELGGSPCRSADSGAGVRERAKRNAPSRIAPAATTRAGPGDAAPGVRRRRHPNRA